MSCLHCCLRGVGPMFVLFIMRSYCHRDLLSVTMSIRWWPTKVACCNLFTCTLRLPGCHLLLKAATTLGHVPAKGLLQKQAILECQCTKQSSLILCYKCLDQWAAASCQRMQACIATRQPACLTIGISTMHNNHPYLKLACMSPQSALCWKMPKAKGFT